MRRSWTPKKKAVRNEELVGAGVAIGELEVQDKIWRAGGKWNRARKV